MTLRVLRFGLMGLLLMSWFGIAVAKAPVVLILGDSLSAAYGIAVDQGWVVLLQKRLAEGKHAQHPYQIVNASVTGETTHGALSRLASLLSQHQPSIVVVELGANDGLRGQPIDEMQGNLRRIIKMSKAQQAKVLLVPMKMPPNMGPGYVRRFDAVYTDLAHSEGVTLSTFILDGVADRPDWLQADNLHPSAEAQSRILENIWPSLETLL